MTNKKKKKGKATDSDLIERPANDYIGRDDIGYYDNPIEIVPKSGERHAYKKADIVNLNTTRGGWVRNKKGNPNIGKVNIGAQAKTLDKKLRGSLFSGLLEHGTYSKLLPKIRKCSKCPLGERRQKVIINDKVIERVVAHKCQYFNLERETCTIPPETFINNLKIFYALQDAKGDTRQLMEYLIFQALQDADANRILETMEKGAGKYYTKQFIELAMKYLSDYNKQKYGQKVEVEQKVYQFDPKEVGLDDEKLYRMGELLLEEKEELVDGTQVTRTKAIKVKEPIAAKDKKKEKEKVEA